MNKSKKTTKEIKETTNDGDDLFEDENEDIPTQLPNKDHNNNPPVFELHDEQAEDEPENEIEEDKEKEEKEEEEEEEVNQLVNMLEKTMEGCLAFYKVTLMEIMSKSLNDSADFFLALMHGLMPSTYVSR